MLHVTITDAESGETLTVEGHEIDINAEGLFLVVPCTREDGEEGVERYALGCSVWATLDRNLLAVKCLMDCVRELCRSTDPGAAPEVIFPAIMGLMDIMENAYGRKLAARMILEMAETMAKLACEEGEA